MYCPQIIGVSVSDTAAEIAIAIVSVTANSWNRRPMMPPMKISGMNTATSEMLIDITVKPICREPINAARIGLTPRSRWRTMFSIITIASSTTKPTEMVSAISEKLSSMKPMNHMPPSVPQIDSGTVTAAAIVGTSRRMKISTTSSTSAMVISMVFCTSSTLARIVVVRSAVIVSLMSGGSHSISCGSSCADIVHGLDDVGARRLGDVEQDCRLLAVPGGEPRVGDAVDHLRHVRQAHDGAVAHLQHQRRVVRRLQYLAVDADRFGAVRALERADRVQHVGALDRVEHVLAGKPGGGQRAGSSRTRTAGFSAPFTVTCATPSACDSRCARMLSAAS